MLPQIVAVMASMAAAVAVLVWQLGRSCGEAMLAALARAFVASGLSARVSGTVLLVGLSATMQLLAILSSSAPAQPLTQVICKEVAVPQRRCSMAVALQVMATGIASLAGWRCLPLLLPLMSTWPVLWALMPQESKELRCEIVELTATRAQPLGEVWAPVAVLGLPVGAVVVLLKASGCCSRPSRGVQRVEEGVQASPVEPWQQRRKRLSMLGITPRRVRSQLQRGASLEDLQSRTGVQAGVLQRLLEEEE